MVSNEIQVRVRYPETDRMGFLYHAHYVVYFDMARTELMRKYGVQYKQMEDLGVPMPVIDMRIEYHKPATYDQVLTVRASIRELPGVSVRFDYEVFNEADELLTTAYTVLAFMNASSGRACRPPAYLMDAIRGHF